MSWTRKVNHPSEIVKKGEEVEAMVLEINPDQQRISLGFKQLQTDPWVNIEHRYRVNDVVHGKVTKLTSFGAFVELEDGIDGLVHISQISSDRVERIKDVLQVGEEVEARVVKIDPEERRIGLSIKAVEQVEEEVPTYEEVAETLRRGEDIVTMHDAFDRAFQGITFEEAEKGKTSGSVRQELDEFEPGAGRKEPAEVEALEAVTESEPVAETEPAGEEAGETAESTEEPQAAQEAETGEEPGAGEEEEESKE
jgi:predicted RNA-binding protein with RPS1 domain